MSVLRPPRHHCLVTAAAVIADAYAIAASIAAAAAAAAARGAAASARLLSDLLPIVSARTGRARDVRRAYADVVAATTAGRAVASSLSSAYVLPFDEYSTRPMTCACLAYASSVYDRLVDLCCRRRSSGTTTGGGVAADRRGEGTDVAGVVHVDIDHSPRSTTPPLRGFLLKLLRMAATDANIREVVLLVLLEPTRRSRGGRQDHRPRRSRPSDPSREEEVGTSGRTSRQSGTSEDALDSLEGPSSPMTFASASSPRGDFVSMEEDAEGACACPPLSTLVRLILRSCPGEGPKEGTDEDDDLDDLLAISLSVPTGRAAPPPKFRRPSRLFVAI